MFDMLTKAQIRHWLRQLIEAGNSGNKRSTRPTLPAIAKYTGIPENTLKWLVHKDTANVSPDRQRLLSKVIGLVENGLLEWESRGTTKVAVLRDKPRPRVRYGVALEAGKPRLTFIDRPQPPRRMPSMKDLLLK